jgi:hypothetical protein
MVTNSINTSTSDETISNHEAKKLLRRVREIMEETEEPFGPAVNIYIKEEYGDKRGGHND